MPLSPLDRSTFPGASLVKIKVNRNQGFTFGTAWPLDERTLVTAAHLFRDQRFPESPEMSQIFAYVGNNELIYEPTRLRIPSGWSGPGWPKSSDYCLMEFSEDLPIAPIPVHSIGTLGSVSVKVCGLRSDNLKWVSAEGPATVLGTRAIQYNLATTNGMSGGPVLWQTQGGWKAIGLHQAAEVTSDLGYSWSPQEIADLGSLPLA